MSDSALFVDSLTKVYRKGTGEQVVALDGISFSVETGEVVGLLGANGAGKTTAIKCVCTLVRPSSGVVRICGADALAHPRRALSHLAAVLEGNRNIYWHLTPRENMEFFAGLRGLPLRAVRSLADGLLEQFDLTAKERAPARMLSRGMQQKLAIACALVQQPDLLLLDEPTLGLDLKTTYELRGILKDVARHGDRTVLLSSHDLQVVQDVCDRVIIIASGRVVADGAVSSLLASFRSQTYRITVDAVPAGSQVAHLRERFGAVQFQALGDAHWVEMEIGEAGGLYDVLDVFRASGVSISSVQRHAPSLEEVFLSLTAN